MRKVKLVNLNQVDFSDWQFSFSHEELTQLLWAALNGHELECRDTLIFGYDEVCINDQWYVIDQDCLQKV